MSTNDIPHDMPRTANSNMTDKEFMKSRMRKCHDCPTLTWDYRCPACAQKWRSKHGVSPLINDAEE